MHPFNIQNIIGLQDEESRASSPASTIELSSDSRSSTSISVITLSSDDDETRDAEEVGNGLRIDVRLIFFS